MLDEMHLGGQIYCSLAYNEGVAASLEVEALQKALDLVASVPNWSAEDHCAGYGRLLNMLWCARMSSDGLDGTMTNRRCMRHDTVSDLRNRRWFSLRQRYSVRISFAG